GDGSADHPYATLARAVAGAPLRSTLVLQAGTYSEPCHFPMTIQTQLTLTQTGGPALIGLPPGNQKICTTRIAELTGDYYHDPEGKPHINNTVPWDVAAVDLGANTEHNGRLYFFFGDAVPSGPWSWPPYNSDPIAYTQDPYPEPNGFQLIP